MIKVIRNLVVFTGFFVGVILPSNAAYFATGSAYNCNTAISSNLSYGSENNDVFTLQQFLSRSGYLNADPNGYFGYSTKSAVTNFQRDNGISATGQVGETTRNTINNLLCSGNFGGVNGTLYSYGSNSNITYVDPYDPYVKVINPPVSNPVVYNYTNTQNTFSTSYAGTAGSNYYDYNSSNYNITPATAVGVQSTNIIYSPYIGYTYGIVPQTGILTIHYPVANSTFNEGDIVNISWSTSNINASAYQIILENTSGGNGKVVAVTSSNNASFVLSRDILESVCYASCSQSYAQSAFRIVIATPITDITGTQSMFRAMVSPITINRPLWFIGSVSLTTNKTPVNSGEGFKLYVNIPTGASWNANIYNQYVFKIRAVCPSSVLVSIAGVPCGQDFTIPYTPSFFQSEIPTTITNSTWYRHNVTFIMTVADLNGNVIGTSEANVTVSPTPFSW